MLSKLFFLHRGTVLLFYVFFSEMGISSNSEANLYMQKPSLKWMLEVWIFYAARTFLASVRLLWGETVPVQGSEFSHNGTWWFKSTPLTSELLHLHITFCLGCIKKFQFSAQLQLRILEALSPSTWYSRWQNSVSCTLKTARLWYLTDLEIPQLVNKKTQETQFCCFVSLLITFNIPQKNKRQHTGPKFSSKI